MRARLLLGVTVLAALAVLASQAVGYAVLRSWLVGRVDQQLAGFRPPAFAFHQAEAGQVPHGGPAAPRDSAAVLPSDFRVYFYDASGRLLTRNLGYSSRLPGPGLAADRAALGLRTGAPRSVAATTGSGHWRVLAQPGPGGMTAVVALPLDTVEGATSKLLWLDVAVLAVTTLGLITVGAWVIRIGLLPLTRLERTARRITAGEPGLRPADTDPRTEIGRLGRVLGGMLDRLQQALRDREASEARLRRFVADAGHELRTPLTAIHGYAELALRHEHRSAAEQREAHRLVAQNAERMSLIVNDLQLLATLDREPSYRSEPVDLLSGAADAVSTAAVHQPSHPVDLGPLPTPSDPGGARELEVVEATGDDHRLRQVVAALLSNAHAHTPPGTRVHVRVGATRASAYAGGTDRPGRSSVTPPLAARTPVAVIEVADEGPGLSPEQAGHVFERFYRADPSRTRARGGSGLGLAIAASIAQAHRGRLELDTRPGRGCVFRLVLPTAPGDPNTAM
ncbi:HAMP domain-containing histidine kinase [Streptomyces sp. PTM05]|uniref:histidine kinase n=1 Tax=Streptantibioticus parmotrematis TaxID=2873249 RepID=A0ABS7QUL7_9ACTN|nr:HAMP domain-containing histidine kinase [Streptantibioticus parmotrematis]